MIKVRLAFLLLALAPVNALAERVLAHGFGGTFLANRASGGAQLGGGGEVRFGRFSAGLEAGLFDRSPFLSLSGSFYAPALNLQKSIVPFFKAGVNRLELRRARVDSFRRWLRLLGPATDSRFALRSGTTWRRALQEHTFSE